MEEKNQQIEVLECFNFNKITLMCVHPATMSQPWNKDLGECLQQICWTNVFWLHLHLHLYCFEKELIYPLFPTQSDKATDE